MKPSILLGKFHIDKDEQLLINLVNYFNQVDLPYRLDSEDITASIQLYQQSHFVEASQFIQTWRASQKLDNTQSSWLWTKRSISFIYDRLLCLILSAICLLCFYYSFSYGWHFISQLTFQDVRIPSESSLPNTFDTILNIFVDGHLWRLFTPIFIHFDWFEICIGLIPFLYLGSQIENNEGKLFFLTCVLFLSCLSHICHFYLASHLMISGISCVNFGLFTYIVCSRTYPKSKPYQLPSRITLFIFLILTMDLWQSPPLITAYIGSLLSGISLVFVQQHLIRS
ncbi:MAG: rhomboid family intramembrane serine protease [Cellvibrionales bacterium]|nr:rhomboid family intramembrane serine protease [Cellvibrionales bacterium]